jgi:uncharacterized protein YcbX
VAEIVDLTSYPIKGCAGTSMRDAPLTPAGLAHDRSFLVIDEHGVFRSQRTHPQLARILPEVSEEGDLLTLRTRGAEPLRVAVDLDRARRNVEMFKAPYKGIDQGDDVAEWLSEALGAKSRLVRLPPEHGRVTDGQTPGTSGFADSSAVHLVSLSSVDYLNERLVDRGVDPLPLNRFRPNIIVSGESEAHGEDRLRRITVGDAELGYAKLAIRCVVTTVDQEAGEKAGLEPLRTLGEYRRASEGGLAFGVKFAVLRPGKVSIGDEVIVTAWSDSEL